MFNADMTEDAAREIARRSRGTPRIANRLLRRVRDFAEVRNKGKITYEMTCSALERLQVDESGLDAIDHQFLQSIIDKFSGGPVGLDTIAAAIGEERHTIEDVYEPYLLQIGFIQRTPRGRMVTTRAYATWDCRSLTLMYEGGRYLIIAGIVLIVTGVLWRYLGKIPGDITFKKGNVTFFIPIVSCIIISIII